MLAPFECKTYTKMALTTIIMINPALQQAKPVSKFLLRSFLKIKNSSLNSFLYTHKRIINRIKLEKVDNKQANLVLPE